MQADRRLTELRKQAARMDGTVLEESDSSDDEGRPEEEAGFQGDNFAIDDETGLIAWDAVVDRTKRPTRAAAAAAAEEERVEAGRRCCSRGSCPRLPVALAVFLLPCVLLVPYYAAIFGTTVTSVNNILIAQVGGVAWGRRHVCSVVLSVVGVRVHRVYLKCVARGTGGATCRALGLPTHACTRALDHPPWCRRTSL